jgi:acetoin utilization deacetylase AcuC-like enzyme
VFPVRRPDRKPLELAVRAGYYCIDTFTPLDQGAYRAARAAVDVALSGAQEVLEGRPVAYAICRPPGHHAGRRVFGGFCYFNNAAVAPQRLSQEGKTAILDIDFHHGNGTQDIFWNRADVLTVSIHGHPNFAYPYFSGFADEVGEGFGRGTNRNFPLPENAGHDRYLQTLDRALELVERFKPLVLVVSLGYDTMSGDPTGSFGLKVQSMETIGRRMASLGRPLLVIQEGGYSLRNLRRGSVAFFRGVTRELLGRDRHRVTPPPGPGVAAGGRPGQASESRDGPIPAPPGRPATPASSPEFRQSGPPASAGWTPPRSGQPGPPRPAGWAPGGHEPAAGEEPADATSERSGPEQG